MILLPSLGPLHILHPRYNAATVLAILEAANPPVVYLASHSEASLAEGTWREEDPLLFHLLPWAEARGVPVVPVDREAHLKGEAEAFREALAQYPAARPHLERLAAFDRDLSALLQRPLTPERLYAPEFLGELGALYEGFVRAFGEGPEARGRALLDRAWLLKEEDDWGALVEQLFAIGSPEALYLAAQVYLASGQWEDALALMEEVFRMDFQHPGYLPGYVLARMGQLLDLAGERERALRAYRGVLALSWAPEEARAVALAGLKTPFRL